MKIFHTALGVKDLNASRKFYETVLGLKFKAQWRRPELNIEFISLEDESGNVVELIQHKNALPTEEDYMNFQKVGLKHLAFVVEQIEPVLERAVANGARIIWQPKKGVSVKRNAFFSDPDGLPVEIVEI